MPNIAVIDTETTWNNQLMSIGVAIADGLTFELANGHYYILLPYKNHGGMYSDALYINDIRPDMESSRQMVMKDLRAFLKDCGAQSIFAYNAAFDFGQLPELRQYQWFDIMKVAAYRQYNKKIPDHADCYETGRLKRGYGVENIYRLLSGDRAYRETHNALFDAADELSIMKMLGLRLCDYEPARLRKA